MYSIVTLVEKSTGFKSANMVKDGTVLKVDGWKEVCSKDMRSHAHAVKELLRLNYEYKRYNLSIDPRYVPRTKRV